VRWPIRRKQKTAKDKQASSVDSREDPSISEVRQQQRTWVPRLELDKAAILWNSSIREFQRRHSSYVAETLKQSLLLPKDMEALRRIRQPNLFMSLKRDLVMVNLPSYFLAKFQGSFSIILFLFLFFYMGFPCHSCAGYPRGLHS